MINLQLFRAYDIRGHIDDLTPAVIAAIAKALVMSYQQHGQHQITIGYDARLDSPRYAKIVYHLFKQAGFEVDIIGRCTSPMLYFIAQKNSQGNGIMITASHNPKHDNGVKWIVKGEPPSPEHIQQIGQLAQQYYQPYIDELQQPLSDNFDRCMAQYRDYIVQDIQLKPTLKIVIDGLNGSAGRIAMDLLNSLDCEVISLRCNADGHFPHHAPDPSVEEHLNHIKQAVKKYQADIGIALDGDGDRLVLIDEHGEMIDADRMLCLFAEICLTQHDFTQQNTPEIVYDIKCSSLVKRTIERYHGKAVMIRTGSSFLRSYIHQAQGRVLFAGEFSGHYAFADGRGLGYDDGIYAGLRVIEYLQQTGKSLSEILQAYPKPASSPDIYIAITQENRQDVLATVATWATHFNADVCTIDGVRLDFATGFILVRASNTGHYFTMRFEAEQLAQLNELQQQCIALLQADYPALSARLAQQIA